MPQRKLFDSKTLAALKKRPIYSQDGKGADAVAEARIFNPYGRGVIYLTEYDGNDTLYGYWKDSDASDGGEYGYFSKRELENTRVEVGGVSLPLERDSGFRATRMGEIRHPSSRLSRQTLAEQAQASPRGETAGTASKGNSEG